MKKLNPDEYYPYTYLISKWAGFFKDFISKFSSLINSINPFISNLKNATVPIVKDENPYTKIKYMRVPPRVWINIPLDKHYTGGQLGKIHQMKYIKTLRLKSKTARLSQCLNTIRVKLLQLNKPVVWPT